MKLTFLKQPKMTQTQEVIRVMEDNGGFSTLGFLYQKVNTSDWKTKTPFASIRRIVQDNRYFFKIKPGLWALRRLEKEVLRKFKIDKEETNKDFNHYYYQGLLIEIGNIRGFSTFIPSQDKNKPFLDKKLVELATINEIYQFTYQNIINRAKTIDVIWFNERKFPSYFFEVEHSTDFQNSLLKFYDLQDFKTEFYIVSSKSRFNEYNSKMQFGAFKEIKNRVKFVDYDFVSNLHSKSYELSRVGDLL